MKKAIFLDMDETLCATSQADVVAREKLQQWLGEQYPSLDVALFTERYLQGVYKNLNAEFPELVALLPDEHTFRCRLIQTLLAEQDIVVELAQAQQVQHYFDQVRMAAFDFYPGVKTLLGELRQHYTLVVITNGPVFSQHPKLAAVAMEQWVDHIIVGGEEPEEKPAASIFNKALALAGCEAMQAIHVGDSLSSDIVGANQMGITSVWVRQPDVTPTAENAPDFTVNHLTELPQILAEWAEK
ncbi:HAD family hydrolase [Vibrio sp. TRT 21S02]|uniref:HAD family hydrolase n=1 Tax=Vibrio sp. TRT 21S02 TaxID=3418507 RepID=UPI003CFA8ACA